MAILTVTYGLPASGKTTWAKTQLGKAPLGSLARIPRDDLRRMLHNSTTYEPVAEDQVTLAQHHLIRTFLGFGVDVIADDTNLVSAHLDGLAAIADSVGAEFRVHDLTHVPVDECVRRDATREHSVGEAVIRRLHATYLSAGSTQ